MNRKIRTRPFTAALALAAFTLLGWSGGGCAVETRRPVAPTSARTGRTSPNPSANRAAAKLPDGPLITRAENARRLSASRIIVGVIPIGSVPFDSQVLPIISPDGRYLATQTGDAPDWPALLAEAGAKPTLTTKIRLYDISERPPREIVPAEPLPPSLLLGRSADHRGALIESPRLDGSRWIGRVNWATGRVEWLVRGSDINAFATLNTRGDLAWMRIDKGGRAELHIRFASGGEESHPAQANIVRMYPSFGNDPGMLYLLELTESGIDIAARTLDADSLGATVARRNISSAGDPFLAYQALIAIQSPVYASSTDPRFAFFNPTTGRITLFDARTGTLTALAEHSIAAAPVNDGASAGILLTTPEGLVYQRLPNSFAESKPMAATRMLAEHHVPRATSSTEFPIILLGPAPNSPGRVNITRLNLPEKTP